MVVLSLRIWTVLSARGRMQGLGLGLGREPGHRHRHRLL